MTESFQRNIARALAVFFVTGAVLNLRALAQEEAVLAGDFALAEKSAALDAAIKRIRGLEEQVGAADAKTAALNEALVTANLESVEFSEAYQALRLKVEALGPELLEKGDSGIRGKLLSAVRDLGLAQKENERLAEQLLTITESVMALLSNEDQSKKSEILASLEKELRSADALLGFRMDNQSRKGRRMEDSRVVSLKKEWGLVVFDIGSDSGVKIGTPVEFVRPDSNRPVAIGTVVNVRESVSGAILTSNSARENFPVQTKDKVRLASANNLQNQ